MKWALESKRLKDMLLGLLILVKNYQKFHLRVLILTKTLEQPLLTCQQWVKVVSIQSRRKLVKKWSSKISWTNTREMRKVYKNFYKENKKMKVKLMRTKCLRLNKQLQNWQRCNWMSIQRLKNWERQQSFQCPQSQLGQNMEKNY